MICKFSVISIKIRRRCFAEIKKNPKSQMDSQRTPNSQNNVEKQNWRPHTLMSILTIKLHALMKMVCCWHKDKHTDQWKWIEFLKMNPCIYSHMIFDKGAKTTQWVKDSLQQIMLRKLNFHMQNNEIGPIHNNSLKIG